MKTSGDFLKDILFLKLVKKYQNQCYNISYLDKFQKLLMTLKFYLEKEMALRDLGVFLLEDPGREEVEPGG